MSFLREKKQSKQAPENTELEQDLSLAVAARHIIELQRAWWERFLTCNACVPTEDRMRERRIGNQVTSAHRGSTRIEFDPVYGDLIMNGKHPIIVLRDDFAVLRFTPEDKFGRPKKAKKIAILGDKGMNRLLRNIATAAPIYKGFHDLQLNETVAKRAPWFIAFACFCFLWYRFGLETMLSTVIRAISTLRDILGL